MAGWGALDHPLALASARLWSGTPMAKARIIARRRTPSGPPSPAAGDEPASTFHPRNRHHGHYDFPRLIAAFPALAPFVASNARGEASIDFADPQAVLALNGALLRDWYGITGWTLPEGYLCPAVPGRADHVHAAADLLAADAGGQVPTGASVRLLDVGTGANLVYPLIAHGDYGWQVVGTEVDTRAIAAATKVLKANPAFAKAITIRRQGSPTRIFTGVVQADERFALVLCNPPFHASADEARAGSERKWRQLGRGGAAAAAPALNFGGQAGELWCKGGEVGFIGRMLSESVAIAQRCCWFTALVAQEAHLPAIEAAARAVRVRDSRIIPMAQGSKRSRLFAWTFTDAAARRRVWSKTESE